MGGSSKQETSQQSQTQPWAAAQPALQGILGKLGPMIDSSGINATQQQGIDTLKANAQSGNPFAGSISNYASDLLNGGNATAQAGAVSSGLSDLKSRLGGMADPSYSSLNDPKLKAALDQIQSDVTSSVNGQFAAAGRDFSGANQNALARGVTAAQAPLILNQFNQDRTNQQNAASTLYNAGNTTSGLLGAMNQQALTNRGTGVTAADSAITARDQSGNKLLNLGTIEQSLPTQALGLLAQIGIPIAGLGGQSSGTSTTTKTPSMLEQVGGWANIFSKAMGAV